MEEKLGDGGSWDGLREEMMGGGEGICDWADSGKGEVEERLRLVTGGGTARWGVDKFWGLPRLRCFGFRRGRDLRLLTGGSSSRLIMSSIAPIRGPLRRETSMACKRGISIWGEG